MERLMKELEFEKSDQEFLQKKRIQIVSQGEEEPFNKIVQDFMGELSENVYPYEKKLEEIGKRTGIHPYTMNQLFLLECALRFREISKEKGYEDCLFLDTMKDLKWKMQECKEIYGAAGNAVLSWYVGFFRMERFALGRMQFEVEEYGYTDYYAEGKHIKKGDSMIKLHIPSGGPLTEESMEDSLARAKKFFADEFPDGVYPFFAETWLLDPDLMKLLPDGNIKRFAGLFTVLEVNKQQGFAEGWRVFGSEWMKKPDQLPRKTRLQRQIAEYLEEGGNLGSGAGIFIRKQ